jgi:ferredoxin
METVKIRKIRKAAIDTKSCVACGCCVKVCPKAAVKVIKGIYAQVDGNLCAGCGKCAAACPASVIEIEVKPS